MNVEMPGRPVAPGPCAGVLLGLALAALAAVAASGFGARFGAWDFRVGFVVLWWGAWAGLAVAALAVVALLIPRLRARRAAWLAVALAAGAAAALPIYWMQQARGLPPINDITTDTANPPEFRAVVPLRARSPVPTNYPGAATA